MNKELEALKQFRISPCTGVNVYADELLDIIETGLKRKEKLEKTLEILKDCCLVREGFGGYELAFAIKRNITKKEYNLLKETFKND